MQSQLLHNHWFGKTVGATCAWIWAPTDPMWLAVAIITGIGLGQLYDSWASYQANDLANLMRAATSRTANTPPYLEYLFAALGCLAKASGSVTPGHIVHAEGLMHDLSLDANARAQAQVWFNQGKTNSYPMQKLSQECLQAAESGPSSRLTILRSLCKSAAMHPDDPTLACLKLLGGYLGFAPGRIAREFSEVRTPDNGDFASNKSSAQHTAPSDTGKPELVKAFQCLNVESSASRARVKLAYRKLVSTYHPDKLPRNASDQAKQHAQQRMVELSAALELIQAHHS